MAIGLLKCSTVILHLCDSEMKLAIMTKSTFFVEEDKILATLFDEGLDLLHLFKPATSPVYSERLLTLLPEDSHRRIIVHENYYLKTEYNLLGIHLDRPDEPLPKGYRGKVGRNCRDLALLKDTKKTSDYVILKNIFDSIETPGEKSNFTMGELETVATKGLIDRHVWALGGITLENIPLMKRLGFGGVVVCGDLWHRFDIHLERDYKELIEHFVKLRKAAD